MNETTATVNLLVSAAQLEADEVLSLTFVDPGHGQVPQWEPGAHLDLVLPSGLRRQYSLCGSPQDRRHLTIAVLREANGRGGSREIHEPGLLGRILTATVRNHFALVPSDRYIFVAGGIGITPIMSMVRQLADTGSWELHYGGRTRSSMAFIEELETLGGDRVHIVPQATDGLLDVDAILAGADERVAIYCCGPTPLLEVVKQTHERLAPSARLVVERFTAGQPPSEVAPPPECERSVELVLNRTGATIEVGPGQTLLGAIREVVPDAPFSCTEGYCGSCEVAVLGGTPDHRDEILSDDERKAGKTMFPCVSRALSPRLVIDI